MTRMITAALVFCSAAFAGTISLSAVDGNAYQQTTQSPCIFTNPSCQQPAGFPSTALPTGGNVTSYDALSPIYNGSTLLGLIGNGNSLLVGLDINQASGQPPQTLSLFTMIKNGSVVDTFSFAGSGNVPAGNNGNGYADFLLGNFSSFIATDTIQFHFVFNDANSGTENLFLIGAPGTQVPEPSSLALIGSGLLLLAVGLFRQRLSH
jgi:PEP-CTERM motif